MKFYFFHIKQHWETGIFWNSSQSWTPAARIKTFTLSANNKHSETNRHEGRSFPYIKNEWDLRDRAVSHLPNDHGTSRKWFLKPREAYSFFVFTYLRTFYIFCCRTIIWIICTYVSIWMFRKCVEKSSSEVIVWSLKVMIVSIPAREQNKLLRE